MATTQRNHRKASTANGAPTIEAVVATVRSLWSAIEGEDGADSRKLKRDISQTIERLKTRVEGRLGGSTASASNGRLLFEPPEVSKDDESASPRFPEPPLRVYAKDLAEQALKQLPRLVDCRTLDEVKDYLTSHLRFNSQSTRRRNANYLVARFFPGECLHADVTAFAAAAAGAPALGDALFYLTARTEKIVASVAELVVFPSLPEGGVSRARIRDFVQAQFPKSSSATQVTSAILNTYQTFGIARATRSRLDVALREGHLASFAYLLHLEFPEPGMYAFGELFDGPLHKWLLWDRAWMERQLYRLRDASLLSKVSEIDGIRQFTTRYTLADAMPRILSFAGEAA